MNRFILGFAFGAALVFLSMFIYGMFGFNVFTYILLVIISLVFMQVGGRVASTIKDRDMR